MASREDIAKEIYYDNFCLERGHGVSYKWEVTDDDIKEKCFLLADYIIDNYISKASYKVEMQGLELEIKLLKDDEVCMKKKLKENVMKARVEVANKAMQALDRIDPTDSSKQILMEKVRIGEIISDNERIPEVSKTIDEN